MAQEEALLGGDIVNQFCVVTPDWRKAAKPWHAMGKRFGRFVLNKENVKEYWFDGKEREVDWEVVILETKHDEVEIIQPTKGDTIYSRFLATNPQGGLHHVVVQPTRPWPEVYSRMEKVAKKLASFVCNDAVRVSYYELESPLTILEFWEFFPDAPTLARQEVTAADVGL